MLRQPTIPAAYRRGPKPLSAYVQPEPRGSLKDSLATKGQLAVILRSRRGRPRCCAASRCKGPTG